MHSFNSKRPRKWCWFWSGNGMSSILFLQCSPLIKITLDQNRIENNNRMIHLTDVFCLCIMGLVIYDYNKRLIIISDPVKRRAPYYQKLLGIHIKVIRLLTKRSQCWQLMYLNFRFIKLELPNVFDTSGPLHFHSKKQKKFR